MLFCFLCYLTGDCEHESRRKEDWQAGSAKKNLLENPPTTNRFQDCIVIDEEFLLVFFSSRSWVVWRFVKPDGLVTHFDEMVKVI